jgi:hypothetical protein
VFDWDTRKKAYTCRWIFLHRALAPAGYADRGDHCLLISATSRSLRHVPCQVKARVLRQLGWCLLLTGLAHTPNFSGFYKKLHVMEVARALTQARAPSYPPVCPARWYLCDLLVLAYPRAICLQVVLGNSYFCWLTALSCKGQSHDG